MAMLALLGAFAAIQVGHAAPEGVGAIGWTGTARVWAGGRTIEIAVDTQVVPFRTARSRSWPINEGADRARTLIIEPEAGFLEFQGRRTALPAALVTHERLQYGLYGLMLTTHARGRCVQATHASAPRTRLCFDPASRLASGSNIVPDPETRAPVTQTFTFSRHLRSQGVDWPTQIRIFQAGQPYFELNIQPLTSRPGGNEDTRFFT